MSVDRLGSADRLKAVRVRIANAARDVHRVPEAVALVAVSKTFGAEDIVPVLEAGHRVFGENRVQEAREKWPGLKERFPGIELHLIGPLQSNKAADAVLLFDVIETIDRPKIARVVAEEIKKQGRRPTLFVQVNTGEERQKSGISPREVRPFVQMCRADLGLSIEGLMCVPPVDDMPAVHFAFLAKLAKDVGVDKLSMGMSGDFETAIQLGSTHVRVGSAIFGHRD
jgi:hypothetical protein